MAGVSLALGAILRSWRTPASHSSLDFRLGGDGLAANFFEIIAGLAASRDGAEARADVSRVVYRGNALWREFRVCASSNVEKTGQVVVRFDGVAFAGSWRNRSFECIE